MSDSAHRIAVTGASGYIGARLVERLEAEARVEFILAMDVQPPAIDTSGKVAFLQHDVAESFEFTLLEHNVDTVVHLAYLLKQEPLVVKGSLERVRDFVYIDDVVTAWKLALEKPVSGVFNLGSGQATSVRRLIAELLTACGLDDDYPVREVEGTPGDQFALSADITAICEALGWEPEVSLREGLARMVDWARAQQREGR